MDALKIGCLADECGRGRKIQAGSREDLQRSHASLRRSERAEVSLRLISTRQKINTKENHPGGRGWFLLFEYLLHRVREFETVIFW